MAADVLRALPLREIETPNYRETKNQKVITKNPIKKIKSLVTCLQLTLKLKLQPLLPQLFKLKLVLCLQLQCHLPTK